MVVVTTATTNDDDDEKKTANVDAQIYTDTHDSADTPIGRHIHSLFLVERLGVALLLSLSRSLDL